MNYYFKFVEIPFNILVGTIILIGILSIVSTIQYKRDFARYLKRSESHVFKYKKSRIRFLPLTLGILILITMRGANTEIEILSLCVGLYLVINQLLEFATAKLCETNILVFTDSEIIDLNGGIKKIKLKEIRKFEITQGKLRLLDKYSTHRINKDAFEDSQKMFLEIEEDYLNKIGTE